MQILATDTAGNALTPAQQALSRLAVGQPSAPSTNFVPYGGTVLVQKGVDMALTPGLLSALPGTFAKVPAGSDFILVRPRPDTTVSVNTRNGGLQLTRTVGQSRVEIRYNFADVIVQSADLAGAGVSGPEFNQALKVTGISPAPAGFAADAAFGAYRTLSNLFIPDNSQGVDVAFRLGLSGVDLSGHSVKVFRENTYNRLASGGAATPASAGSPAVTKI